MRRRQMLIEVAEMVLTELRGHVALRLEELRDRYVAGLEPFLRTGQADLEQSRAEAHLARDKARAAGGAALLAIPISKHRAFLGDAIDVGRFVTHHAVVVATRVPVADVVPPDHEDVGFLFGRW